MFLLSLTAPCQVWTVSLKAGLNTYNGLQDAKNKRLINADTKLRPVVGGQEQVSMFDLSKLVSRHVQ